MTTPISARLPEQAVRELDELAQHYPDRTAAVIDAIHQAWQRAQDDHLEDAYRAAVADNPHHPYESACERGALRARRNEREARSSA